VVFFSRLSNSNNSYFRRFPRVWLIISIEGFPDASLNATSNESPTATFHDVVAVSEPTSIRGLDALGLWHINAWGACPRKFTSWFPWLWDSL
jgi:hypothetical protein